VISTAGQAEKTARDIITLAENDRRRIRKIGRAAPNVLRVHGRLLERPLATARWLGREIGITASTTNRCLAHLERLGIVREVSGKRRNRVFSYQGYLDIMNRGTEPPA
jgi:Fic family protein